MSPWRLFWRMLTGADAAVLRSHAETLAEHERRIDALERKQEAKDAFRRVAGGGR